MISAKRVLLLLTFLPVSFGFAQSTATTGSLQGLVTDPAGVPLAGAVVSYMSVSGSFTTGARHRGGPPANTLTGSVTAAGNGRFTVTGLPALPHLLCATVPGAPYLDPCVWAHAIPATVSAGVETSLTLALTKGVYLNVRVNDPMRLLPQAADGPWSPRKLVVGVSYGAGAYEGAQNTSVDSAGRNYQLIIPAARPFSLWLYSADVALADASGSAAVSPATGIVFQAAPGQNQNFTFSVTGPATNVQ
jgi:hypothetical protein